MEQANQFLQCILDMGEAMISVGSEINRVEDTLTRMGSAYGAKRMDVFAINTNIVITMQLQNDTIITQTRRIHVSDSTDFNKLEMLNALSRRYCTGKISEREIEEELNRIKTIKPSRYTLYIGSALAAGSFAIFFGGTLLDCLAGIVASSLVCFLQGKLEPYCRNKTIFNFLASLVTGIAISIMAHLIPDIHTSQVTIGVIMLLVPGIAMTNAIRNIWLEDTITGVMRLIESLLWTGGLACGFMISFVLGG